jgi:molecular chaperone DnaK
VETKLAALKEALNGDDMDAVTRATEELTKASHVLAEALYRQSAQQQNQGEAGTGGANGGGDASGDTPPGGDKDNVVDAEYEEVQDDKR